MKAGFGLGRLHHVISSKTRERIVLGAIDAGFSHFDLAPCYGDGFVEREVGRLLGHRRTSVNLATKFGIPYRHIGDWPTPFYFLAKAGTKLFLPSYGANYQERVFDASSLISSLDSSLRRLRTDYVDYLFIHEPRHRSDLDNIRDLFPLLQAQHEMGKFKRLGITGHPTLLREASDCGLPTIQVLQIPMTSETLNLPPDWLRDREIFIYGLIGHLSNNMSSPRLDITKVIDWFRNAFPTCTPLLATNSVDELGNMKNALSMA